MQRLLVVLAGVAAAARHAVLAAPGSSNVVLVLTDDQDLLFESMRAMPFTTQLLGGGGATFSNFFAHTPVCCPSRGELLTGRYLHNLRADSAEVNTCMRLDVTPDFEANVFASRLQAVGYTTSMAGKYLNGKTVSHCPRPGEPPVQPPAGWDRYFVMCPDTCYVNCLFGDDGVARWFNDTAFVNGSNYAPSLVGNVTVQFIRETLEAGKPFFAYVAPHSPHTPATPAPWYAHKFPLARAPRTLSYNVSAPQFHWAVRVQPPVRLLDELQMDHIARSRLQTLLTVDDTVREIVAVLQEQKAFEQTFLFFSSDHGFHMGQHCLGPCKRQPYDTDIRIPLYARGPGIAPGSVVHELAGLPDLAPTILEIAGAAPDAGMDGKSMMPLLDAYSRPAVGARASWRGAFLIEYIATQEYAKEDAFGHVIDAGNNTFRGLRVISEEEDLAYFEFTDCVRDWGWQDIQFHELFNLTVDPQQMHNIWNQTEPALQQELALRLRTQYNCSGSTCQ